MPAEDKAQREAIESKNQLDSLIYNVEKVLIEHGGKISGTERGEVENAVADAKSALQSNDKGTMEHAREHLTHVSHKLAEQIYRSAQTGAGRPRCRSGSNSTSPKRQSAEAR